MKGISPIIASVLLIAITMSIAVVLAAYVTSYTREATTTIPSACIGGALFFMGTPSCVGTSLSANVESQFVTLSDFKVDVRNATTGVILQTDVSTSGVSSLAPGDVGTITATLTGCDDIEVRVTTNCFNVKTDWAAP